jgi:hypothetical protein
MKSSRGNSRVCIEQIVDNDDQDGPRNVVSIQTPDAADSPRWNLVSSKAQKHIAIQVFVLIYIKTNHNYIALQSCNVRC